MLTAVKGTLSLSLILLLFSGNSFCASKSFSGVQCGSDIPKALIGRTMPNERVAVTEERYKNLELEDLGGTEISDRLFLISWRICGDEYVLLEENESVRDVLKFPPHSKESPQFIGKCQSDGQERQDTIIAVLKREKDKENLSATVAWRIEEKTAKFVKVNVEGLSCPASYVITADGGP